MINEIYKYLNETSIFTRIKWQYHLGGGVLIDLISSFNRVPKISFFLKKSGSALYYELMPDFNTSCTNKFDYFGNHNSQRFVTLHTFVKYFYNSKDMELIFKGIGNFIADKIYKN